MSARRWVAAGAAAGLTNLVVGFTMAHAIGVEQLRAVLKAHGLRAIGEPSDALPHVVVRLLMGMAVTALYACMTPRFGAGPRAALVSATFAWLFVSAFTAWGHAHIGLFPTGLAWSFAGSGVVEMSATALVGGWVATGSRFWR